jgi:3-dehydroquinate dehydratase
MGPASAPGRILAALSRSALVYGSVEEPHGPGRLALGEMLETLPG